MIERIQEELTKMEADTGARVLLAVESGSRAWGFPSPDSDWDVRFIYAMPVDWYLQVRERRDVIERVDGLLDVSGWEVRKAINLLLRSNASAVEWLRSPVVYRDTVEAADLREFAATVSIDGLRRHYFYLARSIWRERFASGQTVSLKKYFYLLRPALALRYVRLVGEGPPMDLPSLLAAGALPAALHEQITELVAAKAITRELGGDTRLADLDALCVEEMDLTETALGKDPPISEQRYAEADALFRRMIGRAAQGIETRSATTEGRGPKDESPVA